MFEYSSIKSCQPHSIPIVLLLVPTSPPWGQILYYIIKPSFFLSCFLHYLFYPTSLSLHLPVTYWLGEWTLAPGFRQQLIKCLDISHHYTPLKLQTDHLITKFCCPLISFADKIWHSTTEPVRSNLSDPWESTSWAFKIIFSGPCSPLCSLTPTCVWEGTVVQRPCVLLRLWNRTYRERPPVCYNHFWGDCSQKRVLLCLHQKPVSWVCWHGRIQCLPGNRGRLPSISAKMQPTDHTSTGRSQGATV